jgi:HEAT repeat protein
MYRESARMKDDRSRPSPPRLALAARAALALLLAPALLLALASPARGGGGAGEALRWKFEKDGYVFRLGGADAAKILPDELVERTLYAADVRDGRALACPPGRVLDLIFEYAFRLPEDPVDVGASWGVKDLQADLPFYVGPIAVEGEGKCTAKRGAALELRSALKLALGPNPHHDAHFEKGTLTVTSYFHKTKRAIASAEFALEWTEKQAQGQPPKPFAFHGTLELVRPIDLDARRVRDAADRAVKRGVDILKPCLQKAEYRREDFALGRVALALFALEKAGFEPSDPILKAGFDDFERFPPLAEKAGSAETYSVALAILALEGKSVKRAKERPGGGTRIRYEKADAEKQDLDRLEKLTRWLADARDVRGVWSYRKERNPADKRPFGDVSNTQFAALALHAASRAGVKVQPAVFRQLAEDFLGFQEGGGPEVMPTLDFEQGAWLAGPPLATGASGARAPDARRARGWIYNIGNWIERPYASTTAAGVSTLLICREELAKAKALDDAFAERLEGAIRDGLAWLQRRHCMRANWPDYGGWPVYHSYSLEKAFEIARLERIAHHDWWGEGATELLLRERGSGAYGGKGPPAAGSNMPGGWGSPDQTALALLFLTRASTEPEIEVRDPGRSATGEVPAEETLNVVIEGVGAVNAREVVLATEVRDAEKRRERLDLAEKAVQALAEEKRPLLVPPLAKLLESTYAECAKFAATKLRALAGGDLRDRAAAEAFYARWDETTRQGLAGDEAAIAPLRERLRDPLPTIRRAAALALSRLRAVEAIPDLIDALGREEKDGRAYVRAVLVGLLGADPGGADEAKPALDRWQKAWAAAKDDLLRREEVRRAVKALARPDAREQARARLVAIGRPAVRALIDGLQSDGVRPEAARVLEEITGKDFGGDRDAWEAWWREAASGGGGS